MSYNDHTDEVLGAARLQLSLTPVGANSCSTVAELTVIVAHYWRRNLRRAPPSSRLLDSSASAFTRRIQLPCRFRQCRHPAANLASRH